MSNQLLSSKNLKLKYFATLRDEAGKASESWSTTAGNAEGLFRELSQHYGFSLNPENIAVAINHEYTDMDAKLGDGDTVVFIPPVAGG